MVMVLHFKFLVFMDVGVQDPHSAQAILFDTCFIFRIFGTHGSGSPRLPLCTGLAILVMVLYFAFLIFMEVGVQDSHSAQAFSCGNGFKFRIFGTCECGSPGLPLCTGLVI